MKKLSWWALLALAGCGPSGKLTGRVTVIGGDASLAVVTLSGVVTRATPVASDGSYTFEGLPDGVYLVEAAAPSTAEGRGFARGEVLLGKGEVPEMSLTGVGKVSGRVLSPTGAAGAEVFVSGREARQRVGEEGAFLLERVPAGTQTLVAARDGYEPSYAQVNVPYGATVENQILTLSEVAHGAGKISGKAFFFNKTDHSGITVTAEGTQLSAQTDASGSYTLTGAPLGYVTLVFSAEGYQPEKQENVFSAAGGQLRPNDVRLYLGARRFEGYVDSWVLTPDHKALLFTAIGNYDGDYFLYLLRLDDASTPRQLMRVGPSYSSFSVSIQSDYAKLAFRLTNNAEELYAVDLVGGALHLLTTKMSTVVAPVLVADKVFFLDRTPVAANPMLMVFDFVTGQTQTVERVEPPALSCPAELPRLGNSYFQASSDGRVAYHTPSNPGPSSLRLYANGASTTLGAAVSCIGFHGDGMTLLSYNGAELQTWATGSGVRLLQQPAGVIRFTGDDRHALAVYGTGSAVNLDAVPVTGGPVVTVHSQAMSFLHVLQPGGNQIALRDDTGTVQVKTATSAAPVKAYVGPTSTFGFSPKGRRFWHLNANNDLTLASTTDHNGSLVGRVAVGYGAPNFSPQESAALWRVDGTLNWRISQLGGATTNLSTTMTSWQFSANDKYLFADEPDDDVLVNVNTSATTKLGRNAYPLYSYAGSTNTYFVGDGSRAVVRESASSGVPLLGVDPDSGAARHVDDYDGDQYLVLSESRKVLVIDRSVRAQPQGIYELTP
ncbi:MAG: carboxypeptidase regulatory-like domain-containing protein [Myxococcota bacterium]